tara:strand:- start:59 stop:373 length:315 start_codon:yes stop_codon:yes gene_type:complete
MVQRAASAALVVLGINILGLPAVDAASERTTALVTIAEANTRCLVETKRMKAAQARDIANRFLLSKGVSDADREEVQSAPGYDALMRRYIEEQGGCEGLVRALR